MKNYIEQIRRGRNLTSLEMEQASELMFTDSTDAGSIALFLQAIAEKKETAEEVAALAGVMRRHAIQPPLPEGTYFDNCGTGGDCSGSFNISTASAFVLAACGVRVAKHGNRKISSAAGSHDVLEALGIPADLSAEERADMMRRTGMTFLFAPAVHPKLKRIGVIRRQLARPTVFNMVGPLASPADLHAQYTGIPRSGFVMEYAAALRMLGRRRAVVVSGAGGLDEASLAGRNTLVFVDGGDLIPFTLAPEDVGLQQAALHTVQGGDADENARIIRSVFAGERGPKADTVALNAGIGLFAEGTAGTIREGVALAEECIRSGRAQQQLDNVIGFCEGARKGAAAR
ncbi:anthranilate phosphoribosyltransferase [Sporosarcina sp. NCCP-2716]|uniref:anthranilate phosphoribosyltransferase n=1 Tax=Sporosarcina sp. NCCP-2716 TaxID=2943679 RepID=UPI00203BAADC|nr:anthranilate phosphoribosyltransferase [Sporosarcina sp. NCCP-2716]GKV68510.1 anthranilate phosphoribosyltransferase [Sporosarcina sp. NCCP-2716]